MKKGKMIGYFIADQQYRFFIKAAPLLAVLQLYAHPDLAKIKRETDP